MWRFTTKRYAVFVLLIAVAAGGLRFWADVDWATLVDRYPHIGHASLDYFPLGLTIGLILNMPVTLFCALVLPFGSGLPRYSMQGSTWTVWMAEAGVATAQAAITALFWFLLRIFVLRLRNTRTRYLRTLFTASVLAALGFTCGAVWAAVEGYRGVVRFLTTWSTYSDIIAYVKGTHLSEASLVEPVLYMALAAWCSAATALLMAAAARMRSARATASAQ